MSNTFTESVVEEAALDWFEGLGYVVLHGPEIAFGTPAAERSDPSYRDVILERRLRETLARLNPALPPEALEDAYQTITRIDVPSLLERNRSLHQMLVDGAPVEYRRKDGSIAGAQARVIDFDDMDGNDWLAVNQFTVVEGKTERRPDVVVFVNGLPVIVIELKNLADENATIWTAYQQLQTYQAQIPSLFTYNVAMIVSDGMQARIGTLGAGKEWFKPWRTITGQEDVPPELPELQVVLEGVLHKNKLLDLMRHFIVFEDFGEGALVKKMAGYHQFHAVNAAIEQTLRASSPADTKKSKKDGAGDRRIGVVWHTQGSGKSLTMVFYAGRAILHPAMENPTLIVLTDRNDLDDQPLEHSRDAIISCAKSLPRQGTGRTCGNASVSAAVGSCSRRSRSSCPRRAATGIQCSPTGETLSLSLMKPTEASTTSSMASRVTCTMLCRTPHS